MTTRRLVPMFQMVGQDSIAASRPGQTLEADNTSSFLQQGTVEVARADGSYEVNISNQGERQLCSAVTDEPIEQNMLVWVSKTQDGSWIIHGSVK
jgi:hypothetical protein